MTEIKEPQPIYPGRETDAIKEITQNTKNVKQTKNIIQIIIVQKIYKRPEKHLKEKRVA